MNLWACFNPVIWIKSNVILVKVIGRSIWRTSMASTSPLNRPTAISPRCWRPTPWAPTRPGTSPAFWPPLSARAQAVPRVSPAWSSTRPTAYSRSRIGDPTRWTWTCRGAACCRPDCWLVVCRQRRSPCLWTTCSSTPSPSASTPSSGGHPLTPLVAIHSHYRNNKNLCTERTNKERVLSRSKIWS